MASERVDLHTHSSFSDGALTPQDLVARAAARQVHLLALTDHDTTDGCAAAASASQALGLRFVPGVELTCDWQEREIHVIGLNIDAAAPALTTHCQAVQELRRERVRRMAERLTTAGLPGAALSAAALASSSPTRTHLARALCAQGYAADPEQAFERWLKRGRPGYSPASWPAMQTVISCIIAAGGVAVLAHPHRYQFSGGKLRDLVYHFKQFGGVGIEVSLAGISPGDRDRLAGLARRFELAGSIGSDFHEPDIPWRPLGRFAKLPENITPIMEFLEPVRP